MAGYCQVAYGGPLFIEVEEEGRHGTEERTDEEAGAHVIGLLLLGNPLHTAAHVRPHAAPLLILNGERRKEREPARHVGSAAGPTLPFTSEFRGPYPPVVLRSLTPALVVSLFRMGA